MAFLLDLEKKLYFWRQLKVMMLGKLSGTFWAANNDYMILCQGTRALQDRALSKCNGYTETLPPQIFLAHVSGDKDYFSGLSFPDVSFSVEKTLIKRCTQVSNDCRITQLGYKVVLNRSVQAILTDAAEKSGVDFDQNTPLFLSLGWKRCTHQQKGKDCPKS